MKKTIHALGLVSGGLDSTLAAALLLEQGLEVTGINIHTGFCVLDHRRQMGERGRRDLENPALKTECRLYFPVELVDISQEYLALVTHPRYGYGRNANPCIDCRIMMLQKAKALMAAHEADFIFTGEVLGQRPMTQMRRTLDLIERKSGLEGYLLRPLSALRLPPTVPEKEGWVDRSRLKDFCGRTRKPQIALAEELGINDYPAPAGGCCFLTDPGYARKFFDLLDHRPDRRVTVNDFTLLKVGRHLRPEPDLKLIVGRNEGENEFLRRYTDKYTTFEVVEEAGPLTLMEGLDNADHRRLAAAVTARYSDAPPGKLTDVRVNKDGKEEIIQVYAISSKQTDDWLIK